MLADVLLVVGKPKHGFTIIDNVDRIINDFLVNCVDPSDLLFSLWHLQIEL